MTRIENLTILNFRVWFPVHICLRHTISHNSECDVPTTNDATNQRSNDTV